MKTGKDCIRTLASYKSQFFLQVYANHHFSPALHAVRWSKTCSCTSKWSFPIVSRRKNLKDTKKGIQTYQFTVTRAFRLVLFPLILENLITLALPKDKPLHLLYNSCSVVQNGHFCPNLLFGAFSTSETATAGYGAKQRKKWKKVGKLTKNLKISKVFIENRRATIYPKLLEL